MIGTAFSYNPPDKRKEDPMPQRLLVLHHDGIEGAPPTPKNFFLLEAHSFLTIAYP